MLGYRRAIERDRPRGWKPVRCESLRSGPRSHSLSPSRMESRGALILRSDRAKKADRSPRSKRDGIGFDRSIAEDIGLVARDSSRSG